MWESDAKLCYAGGVYRPRIIIVFVRRPRTHWTYWTCWTCTEVEQVEHKMWRGQKPSEPKHTKREKAKYAGAPENMCMCHAAGGGSTREAKTASYVNLSVHAWHMVSGRAAEPSSPSTNLHIETWAGYLPKEILHIRFLLEIFGRRLSEGAFEANEIFGHKEHINIST